MLELLLVCVAAGVGPSSAPANEWSCEILPPERQTGVDPQSGARVVFVTTHRATDQGLYFHERSWLSDGSMLIFLSQRTGRSEPFGYVESFGHLVQLIPDGAPATGLITCARAGNRIFAVREGRVVEWHVSVKEGDPPAVRIRERQVTDLSCHGASAAGLSENADGRYLGTSFADAKNPGRHQIIAIELATGRVIRVAALDFPAWHVQFSWTQPDLILFSRSYPEGDRMPPPKDPNAPPHCRMWLVRLDGKPPRPIHLQRPNELVTHECWWTEDRITFCGGHHVPEESHLKVYDMKTGRISILGAGSWWPGGDPDQIRRRAWWHAAGSPDGRWAVADNPYGDIVLFDAFTTEERLLTGGHRKPGESVHAHPGWAPSSDRVVFTSTQKGNADVVIAYVPKGWR